MVASVQTCLLEIYVNEKSKKMSVVGVNMGAPNLATEERLMQTYFTPGFQQLVRAHANEYGMPNLTAAVEDLMTGHMPARAPELTAAKQYMQAVRGY
jgi:hypothetical protein